MATVFGEDVVMIIVVDAIMPPGTAITNFVVCRRFYMETLRSCHDTVRFNLLQQSVHFVTGSFDAREPLVRYNVSALKL